MDLALFDFDGTLTTREMFPDFLRYAVRPRRLALGKVLLAPAIAGYRLGIVPGNAVRASIVRVGFQGVAESEILAAGSAFAADVVPGALRPLAMERIDWHRARCDRIVVVSGSLDAYLAPWCAQQGLDLLCSELETREGTLTGRYRGAQCVDDEKARRVRERHDLAGFGAVHAYGDTHEDHAMLALADRKFFRWQEIR